MLLSPVMSGIRKRSIEMDALSETEHANIREFTMNASTYMDVSSKSKFSALIAQYLTNSIKLNGLIKEVRYISPQSPPPDFTHHSLDARTHGR
jgi:hypothetical protein